MRDVCLSDIRLGIGIIREIHVHHKEAGYHYTRKYAQGIPFPNFHEIG
jgi:hypothetical protein